MAQVIRDLRQRATSDERKVLELLRGLPDEYLIWLERHIEGALYFIVLHGEIGAVILEVVDLFYPHLNTLFQFDEDLEPEEIANREANEVRLLYVRRHDVRPRAFISLF